MVKKSSKVIQSSNEVITEEQGVIGSLGPTTPGSLEKLDPVEQQGPCNGPVYSLAEQGDIKLQAPIPLPAVYKEDHVIKAMPVFITMNFPRNDKIRLNKKMNYKYKDYKTIEQRMIIKRIENLFRDLEVAYIIAFEYCKDMSLHCHCIVDTTLSPRDMTIEIKRYYGISYDAFCITKNLPTKEDLIKVYDYIIHKDVKTYQNTGFKPLENNFNIKELISKYNIYNNAVCKKETSTSEKTTTTA